MAAFLGMRGTGEWPTNAQPENWRESLLFLKPNGTAPLFAMMSMLGNRTVDDPTFHWWTKILPAQGGTVTEVYTDAALSAAYTSGGVAGTVLYAKMAAALADELREGHQVLLRKSDNSLHDTSGKVVGVVKNGASSYAAVKLLEAANATTDLDVADRILVTGNINPEGSTMPDAIAYDPTEYSNYTQIFRTPLEITRTARSTKLRYNGQYEESVRETLEIHSMEIEKALIWGRASSGIGSNKKPERTTRGLVSAGRTYNASGVDNYTTNETYDGDTWLTSGETWLDARLELAFRYGSDQKIGFAGTGAILGINRLIKNNGNYDLQPMTTSYGIKVMRWVTPFGELFLKVHPLFSYESTNSNEILVFEPGNLRLAIHSDGETRFIKDPQDRMNRNHSLDGTQEEFLTELGLEWDHPETIHIFSGVGQDNP